MVEIILPTPLRNQPLVDQDGKITDDWWVYLSNLIQSLYINANPEGLAVPEQPAANIATIENINSQNTFVVDSTNGLLKFNINGIYYTVPLI